MIAIDCLAILAFYNCRDNALLFNHYVRLLLIFQCAGSQCLVKANTLDKWICMDLVTSSVHMESMLLVGLQVNGYMLR